MCTYGVRFVIKGVVGLGHYGHTLTIAMASHALLQIIHGIQVQCQILSELMPECSLPLII